MPSKTLFYTLFEPLHWRTKMLDSSLVSISLIHNPTTTVNLLIWTHQILSPMYQLKVLFPRYLMIDWLELAARQTLVQPRSSRAILANSVHPAEIFACKDQAVGSLAILGRAEDQDLIQGPKGSADKQHGSLAIPGCSDRKQGLLSYYWFIYGALLKQGM